MGAELRTDRLTLRPLALSDAPRLAHLTSDPDVARMVSMIPCPSPVVAMEGFILIMQAREPLQKDHVFAIDLPGVGAIGCVGAHDRGERGFEIGYYLGRDFWGQGFATEAASAVCAHMAALGVKQLEAGHFVDNPASGRVLEKVGFEATGEIVPRFSVARGAKAPLRMMKRWMN